MRATGAACRLRNIFCLFSVNGDGSQQPEGLLSGITRSQALPATLVSAYSCKPETKCVSFPWDCHLKNQTCDFIIAMRRFSEKSVEVEIESRRIAKENNLVAIGFNKEHKMPGGFFSACHTAAGVPESATGTTSYQVAMMDDPALATIYVDLVSFNLTDDKFKCKFRQLINSGSVSKQAPDLTQDYYIMAAQLQAVPEVDSEWNRATTVNLAEIVLKKHCKKCVFISATMLNMSSIRNKVLKGGPSLVHTHHNAAGPGQLVPLAPLLLLAHILHDL